MPRSGRTSPAPRRSSSVEGRRSLTRSESRTWNNQEVEGIPVSSVYDGITSATNRLTDCSIEPFDGTKSNDIQDWLRRYNDFALARRWDEIAKKEQLPTFFVDSPGKWLAERRRRHVSPIDPDKPALNEIPWSQLTWKQVERILIKHYSPQDR